MHEKILDTPDPSVSKLSSRKDHGGLIFPSGSVFKIISTTETVISREVVHSSKLPDNSNLAVQIRCRYSVVDHLFVSCSLFNNLIKFQFPLSCSKSAKFLSVCADAIANIVMSSFVFSNI